MDIRRRYRAERASTEQRSLTLTANRFTARRTCFARHVFSHCSEFGPFSEQCDLTAAAQAFVW
jgi:hypothetical protein